MILMKLSTEQQISSLAGPSWDRRKVVSCSDTFNNSVSTMSLVARVCSLHQLAGGQDLGGLRLIV